MTFSKVICIKEINKEGKMSQGVMITLIICGTVLVISVVVMGFIAYIVKKGMGFAEKQSDKESEKEPE